MNSLSVVIPTKDRFDALARTLDALGMQETNAASVETIVVDNGSGPDAVERLRARAGDGGSIPIRLLEHPSGGPAAARNAGVAAANGEVILFLGDDTEPAGRDLLRAHLALHAERPEEHYAVLGRITWNPRRPISPFMRWLENGGPQFHYWALDSGPVDAASYFYSSHVSVKRSMLERIGGFDAQLSECRGRGHGAGGPPRRWGTRTRLPPRAAGPARPPDDAGAVAATLRCRRPLRRPLQPAATRPPPPRGEAPRKVRLDRGTRRGATAECAGPSPPAGRPARARLAGDDARRLRARLSARPGRRQRMSLRRLNASILSPLLVFPLAWVFAALLSQLHLLNAQDGWSTVMVAVVIAVPLAFVAGGLIGEAIATATTALSRARTATTISERTFRRALVAMSAIGLLEIAHQFALAGTVPLLSGSIDAARFSQGGPTIILTDLLTVAAIVALTKPRDLFAREARFELAIAAVAIGAFGLQGGRGSVVLPIVVALAARWLYWGRPNAYLLTGGGLLAVLAISIGFYLRVYQHPTTPFESELFGEILPPLPFFLKLLIPVYLALTTNFLALEGIVGHFPTVQPFGHGVYDALALDNFISGARSIGEVSASTTPPWVTSTVAGPLWADGGFAVVVLGVALTGLLSAGAYAAAVRTLSFRWSLVAAYLFFTAIFGLYTNLWTQHIDWLIVAPLLLVFGSFAERPDSPPGVVGRLWGKIRGMREPPATPADNPGGDRSRLPSGFRAALLAAGAAIAVLLVAGLAIQATLPEPYPVISTERLPRGIAEAEALMTDGDRGGDNSVLWWVEANGDRVVVRGLDPHQPRGEPVAVDRFRQPGAADASFDVGRWPPLRGTALFVIRQRGNNLETIVRDLERHRVHERMISTVGPPLPGTTRDYAVASYTGKRQPDLFIVDRDQEDSRVLVRILSGVTDFRRQALATSLPFRGLSPEEWSLDLGAIAAGAVEEDGEEQIFRADLALVQKDSDRAHANLKLMLGEDGYEGFALQRDLDVSGDVAPDSVFMIGTDVGAAALYQIVPAAPGGPLLRIFSMEPPTGLL